MKASISASFDAPFHAPDESRRHAHALALDDHLLAEAASLTGVREKSALVREALKALIEREGARRLACLGGTQPDPP